ncbi:hypothetical protein B0H13DRAFT_2333285 [Mycena leptocephala]|nr:hypothetical protein B0H13DRAFT_2333285 [Mycena leptocephala]
MTQLDHDETSSLPVYDIDELDQDGAPIPVYDIEEILAALTLEEGIERPATPQTPPPSYLDPHATPVRPTAPPSSSRVPSATSVTVSEAAHATQGSPHSYVRALRQSGPRKQTKRNYAAYVVFRGRTTGVFFSWAEVEAATSGFRFALQQGYSAIDDAHLVFEHAQCRGWTSDSSAWSSTPMSASDAPVPLAHERSIAPLSAQGGPLSSRSPNDPCVECALNVLGVSCSAHERVDSYAEAWQKFRRATTEGEVHFVPFPASPPPGGPPDNGPRNRDERNRQTRERMARLRAQDAVVAPDVLAARLAARREAARKYREKNRRKIALKARETRARAAQERARNRDQTDRAAR